MSYERLPILFNPVLKFYLTRLLLLLAVLGIKKIYTLKKVVGQSRSSAAPVPAIQQDSNLQPPADGDVNCTFTFYSTTKPRVIGFLSEWINTYSFLKSE